jgi:hypothetical protein
MAADNSTIYGNATIFKREYHEKPDADAWISEYEAGQNYTCWELTPNTNAVCFSLCAPKCQDFHQTQRILVIY